MDTLQLPLYEICDVGGCTRQRYGQRRLCNTHAMRKHRYGDVHADRSRAGRTWDHSSGYRIVGAAGHQLADSKGSVYEHRLVLFNEIGPGPHGCHWCGDPVDWADGLEADHLNNQRDDNRPENLVPSCHGCNTRRALKRRWHGVKDDHRVIN